MHIVTLDVKSTHCRNPECPSRIAQQPNGSWMCVDCGLPILHKRIDTDEPPGGLDEDDVPIHVEMAKTPEGETILEEYKGLKLCEICRLPMIESMTHLYYYCPTCGLSLPKEGCREAITVPARKWYG